MEAYARPGSFVRIYVNVIENPENHVCTIALIRHDCTLKEAKKPVNPI